MIGIVGRLLASSAGAYVVAGGIALALAGGIWRAGYNYAQRGCEAASLRSELAAVRQDLAIAQAAERQAQTAAADLDRQNSQNQEKLRAYETAIQARPADRRCALSADDARRLRELVR